MTIVTRTVVGTYTNIDGTPTSGYLEFSPSSVLVAQTVIPVSSKSVALDATGSFSIELECTDALGVTPVGWLWSVEEKFRNGNTWYLAVPTSSSPLNIVDAYVIPPSTVDGGGTSTPGAPGVGVPPGGIINQVLAKATNIDYDTRWVTAETGGGTSGVYYYTTLGAHSAGLQEIIHNLNTLDVDVDVYVNEILSTAGDWNIVDENTVEVILFSGHDAGVVRIVVKALDGTVGMATDHGTLTGLADDDHPQYAKSDGTRGSFAAPNHHHDATYLKPSQIVAGSNVSLDTVSIPGSTIISSTGGTSGGSSGAQGGLLLDDFAGATDDAKLATAITTISAMTHKVPILLAAGKVYTFNNACPTIYDGFAMIGARGGGGNPEQGSSGGVYGRASMTKVKINYSGTWLNSTSTRWNVRFHCIDFTGTSTTVFANSSGVAAWCWHWRDVGFNTFKSVLGTKTAHAWLDAVLFDGWWDVANMYEGAFHVGGSDNHLWMNGMLIDSPEAYAVGKEGQYLIRMIGFQKNAIGPIYMTVQNRWRGIYIEDMSTSTQGVSNTVMFMPGGVIEGRNDGLSGEGDVGAQGCLIRIKGASAAFTNWIFNHAMYAPNATGFADTGVIMVDNGGDLQLLQASYARQNKTLETVPFIYATGAGSTVNALQVRGCQSGGEAALVWTGKPRYQVASGATISNADSSMQTV
jgi:hypothetical protein